MLKKIALAASTAAVVLGAGTAALAVSGHGSPVALAKTTAAPKATASAQPGKPGPGGPGAQGHGKGHRPELRGLGRALHAQWVTRDRDNAGAFVTHNAIRGEVTAVSASSITIKAQDGVSQTYAVTSATKVRVRTGQPGKRTGAAGKISDVHTGDKVAVAGIGATNPTAQHIVAVTD
jgi:hypothetical protein